MIIAELGRGYINGGQGEEKSSWDGREKNKRWVSDWICIGTLRCESLLLSDDFEEFMHSTEYGSHCDWKMEALEF